MKKRKLISTLLIMLILVMMVVAIMAPALVASAQTNGDEEPPPDEEPPEEEEPLPEEKEPPPIYDEIISKIWVRNLQITPGNAQPRQAVAIAADVVNEGNRWESVTLDLLIDGQFEQSVQVGVSPLTTEAIDFTVYRENSGQYQVTIGEATGWFNVLSEPQKAAGQPVGGGLGTAGIITVTVIVVLFVAGMVIAFKAL